MLLLIDNYDSFTYNLVHCFQVLKEEVLVVRNNAKTVEECLALSPAHIVIGPGPGTPARAGISKSLICRAAGKIPILGVCLGHQAIAEVFGGRTIQSPHPTHGKCHHVYHRQEGVFTDIPSPFLATRYHSLVIERETLPPCLSITAETADRQIMGVSHHRHHIYGVQFHPESITTESGLLLLTNFLNQRTSTTCKENNNENRHQTDHLSNAMPLCRLMR
ncbi:MAG: aminodeoxychorismate/anthranilate synthase component II [Chlamydiales bacterium]|nr:aminodeoxychorismate/anthranilate synthase component II [Chlamydiia bacterium]MCP5506951.1 aminodeoxychorismate/anthranilate synthase component II [Chlamydiales bacterium]